MRWMTAAILAASVCVSASAGDLPPQKTSEQEVEFAATVTKKVDQDEAAWRELTAKLVKAVEAYNPQSLHVAPEGQSLEAFRAYCQKLLESGRVLVALHEKWGSASQGLGDSLRKAPAYYRSAARAMRDKAQAMRFQAIKERYHLAADIWEELARKAEERAKDLSLDQGSKGVVDLIREENAFLEDFVKTLDALPKVSGEDSGSYADLLDVLRNHAQKSDELHRQLRLFREKLRSGGSAEAKPRQ